MALELWTLREIESAVEAAKGDVSTRLFVKNIPSACSDETIRDAFKKVGIQIKEVIVPKDGDRNRGFAFVEVMDHESAMNALDARPKISGRTLVVNEAHALVKSRRYRGVRKTRGVSERLYVGNLSQIATEQSIRQLFEGHGFRLLDVYIAADRSTGIPKGFAFVSLASDEEAERAIGALNGSVVNDRHITVRPAAPRSINTPNH